jgi:hypothetical protein
MMNGTVRRSLYMALLAAAMIAVRCGIGPGPLSKGGNSSEVPNGLALVVSDLSITGTTRPGACVGIYSTEYSPIRFHIVDSNGVEVTGQPDFECRPAPVGDSCFVTWKVIPDSIVFTADSAIADTSGHFEFDNLAQGLYNLVLIDTAASLGRFVERIPVYADSSDSIAYDSLLRTGTISGTASVDDTIPFTSRIVAIPGTPFAATADSLGNYLFEDVPPGEYRIDYFGYPPLLGNPQLYSSDSVEVASDSTSFSAPTFITYPQE